MLVYNVSFTTTNIPAANTIMAALWTTTTASVATGRSVIILEIDVEGATNTSNYSEFGLFRIGTLTGALTAATTITSPVTTVSVDQTAPAAASTWVAGPLTFGTTSNVPYGATGGGVTAVTQASQPIHRIGINVNGQRYFWRANPNLSNAIVVSGQGFNALTTPAGGLLVSSIVQGTTSNPVSFRIQYAEL